MKKPIRNKSISSSTNAATSVVPTSTTSDLELFSSYSHEQVHIYDKLCSSISSICEIAYCTSEGIILCVPQTYQRQTTTSQNISSPLAAMLIARISYPFESTDPTNSISVNASSLIFFEKLKEKYLARLYQAYKHRPTSLSSFDHLLCSDINQYRGFRRCLFSPLDITLNEGQSLLATITCAHEVFIYEIISSSKRFFLSQSSNLKYDLTKRLLESSDVIEKYLQDSESENDYRLLYFHLTSNILWNQTGTLFFQLQYSGHLIVWKLDGSLIVNDSPFVVIDTKISKPLSMVWNEECQMLIVIGKENQRVLINVDQMKLFDLNMNENDYMIVEHSQLIKLNDSMLVLIESKMNYCLIYSIPIGKKQSTNYDCNQIDCRVLPSTIVGFYLQQYSTSENHISILIGCEDGTMYSLVISRELPVPVIDVHQTANGHIKSCSRKPLLLRHFNLSSNEMLLARIFYSPIVAPNVKFGFVLCTIHRWLSNRATSFDSLVENFLGRIHVPLWRSSDELAVILSEVTRGTVHHDPMKKNTNGNFLFLQRLCRLYTLLNDTKQLQQSENQLLQIYRHRFADTLKSLFSKMVNKLSQTESSIYTICCKNEQLSSSTHFTCPLCNTALTMTTNELLVCHCSNKHPWPRCCRTLLPLPFECSQTCTLCDRTITCIDINDKNYSHFVKYREKELSFLFSSLCTYCM